MHAEEQRLANVLLKTTLNICILYPYMCLYEELNFKVETNYVCLF